MNSAKVSRFGKLGFLSFGLAIVAGDSLHGQVPGLQFTGRLSVYEVSQGADTRLSGAAFASYDLPAAAPAAHITALDGSVRNITVGIPGAARVAIRSVATGSDGTVAICGFAESAAGQNTGFVELVAANNAVQKLIQAGSFLPSAIAIAPDGTLWLKGTIHNLRSGNPVRNTNEAIIRHLDRAGVLMNGFISAAGLTTPELFGVGDYQYLIANADRVGWYSGRGAKYYFEVTSTGKVAKYPALDGFDRVGGLALMADDQVFITGVRLSGGPATLFTLDRSRGQWVPVALPSDKNGVTPYVLGSAGNTIALKGANSGGLSAELFKVQ